MTKVQILTSCNVCNGAAFVPAEAAISASGEPYTRYVACTACQGSGTQAQWIPLRQFVDLLEAADHLEPDYLELAHHQPISQYQDSCEAAGV